MNVNKFIDEWKKNIEENIQPFIENMDHLNIKDQSFSSWIKIWVAWNELSSEDDIDTFYGWLDE